MPHNVILLGTLNERNSELEKPTRAIVLQLHTIHPAVRSLFDMNIEIQFVLDYPWGNLTDILETNFTEVDEIKMCMRNLYQLSYQN